MRKAVVLVLVVAGCRSDASDPLADYLANMHAAYCERYVRCGGLAASHFSECITEGQGKKGAFDIPELVRAGHLRFNPESGAACIDAERRSPCNGGGGTAWHLACDKVFVGLAPLGGPCSDTFMCADGWCDNGGHFGCAGTC